MKKHLRQIFFLIITSVVFTELLTGNISIAQFADPVVPIFLLTIGYGIPVLLIRELSVRWGAGLLSLFLLGLAYGIWNEGILAKTLLLNTDFPMSNFYGYTGIFGVNYAWGAVIVTWHAFFAVSFPILISHAIFPDSAKSNWISRKTFWTLAAIVPVPAGLIFMFEEVHGILGAPELLALFAIAMAALVCAAGFLRKTMPIGGNEIGSKFKLPLAAFFFVVALLYFTNVLGAIKAPAFLIVALVFFIVAVLFGLLKKYKWVAPRPFAVFALYVYICFGFFIILWSQHPIVVWTVAALEAVFLLLISRVFKTVKYDK